MNQNEIRTDRRKLLAAAFLTGVTTDVVSGATPAARTAEAGDAESVDPSAYYMRTAPRFDVPEGRYAWMSRHVFVGVAEKTPQGNSINYFMIV